MIYGSETWTPTKAIENKLGRAQRRMERSILGISIRDRKGASWERVLPYNENFGHIPKLLKLFNISVVFGHNTVARSKIF